MKGKPWTVEEEKRLKQLLAENKSVRGIARTLGKTRDCIHIKIARLGLEVVVPGEKTEPTTTATPNFVLPDELPSIEEELKVLAAALKGLETPQLSKTEVNRLGRIIHGVKAYQELIAQYADYRGLEKELFELREKYAINKKSANSTTK